jgi:hypothetical protein
VCSSDLDRHCQAEWNDVSKYGARKVMRQG